MRNLNVPKRSVMIAGHRTSVSLEKAFWDCLKEIAADRGTTVAELIAEIDQKRSQSNLSSAIRLFVLEYFQNKAATVSADRTRRKSEGTPPVR
jgi:predicted DNA-binding ribbon-helix-helix protein